MNDDARDKAQPYMINAQDSKKLRFGPFQGGVRYFRYSSIAYLLRGKKPEP